MSIEWAEFDQLVLEVKVLASELLKEISEEWIGVRKAYMQQQEPQQPPSTGETE